MYKKIFFFCLKLYSTLYNIVTFSAWGDAVFLGVQTLIIAILVMHYNGDTAKATAFLSAYLAVLFTANSGLTPIHILWACQAMNIPIVLISKVYNLIIKIKSWKREYLISFITYTCIKFYKLLINDFT